MSETSVRGDLEWGTIPRLLRSATDRFPAREAIVDVSDGTTLSFTELAAAAHDAARAFIALGIERGDRVAIWAPNVWEWVVAALGLQSAGGVLVPLNTRFKGREAAYILGKSRAEALVTVTGFLDTDYVALLRDAVDVESELPDLETHRRRCAATRPRARVAGTDFLAGGERRRQRRSRRARAVGGARRPLRHPVHVGHDREPEGRDAHARADAARAIATGARSSGCATATATWSSIPFFHAFGYKAGWLASLMMGATVLPHPVFDAEQVLARVPRRPHQRAAGTADAVPDDPQPPRSRRATTCRACGCRSPARRRSRSS